MIIFQPLFKKIKDNFFLQFFGTATVNLTDLKNIKNRNLNRNKIIPKRFNFTPGCTQPKIFLGFYAINCQIAQTI